MAQVKPEILNWLDNTAISMQNLTLCVIPQPKTLSAE
jgi:hypothetical protein